MNPRVKFALKMLATVLAIALVVHVVDFRKALAGIRAAHMGWFLGSIGLLLLSIQVQAIRWRGMLQRSDIPLHKFTYFLFMGSFLNLVIPSQVGSDLVRSAAFGRKYGEVGLNIGLAMAQRVLGLGVMSLFAGAGWWFYREELSRRLDIGITSGRLALLLLALVAVATAGWLLRRRLRGMESFRALLQAMTNSRLMGWALLHSFTIQLLTSVSTWMLFRAVLPDPDYWQVTLFSSIIQVALLLPLSLGGVGVRDVLNLVLFGQLGGIASESIITIGLLGYTSLLFLAGVGAAWMGFRWVVSGHHPLRQAEEP